MAEHGFHTSFRTPKFGPDTPETSETTECHCGELFKFSIADTGSWGAAVDAAFAAVRAHEVATWETVTGQVIPTKDIPELLGVSMHTGLRKGTDAADADAIWRKISDSDSTAWHDAAEYAAWCLEEMGFKIVKVAK